MASAIGIALLSTILTPMAEEAMKKVTAMVVARVDGIVNIKRDISNLQTTLKMIAHILQEAEKKQIDYDDFIQNWLCDLADISYEARDVLDDFLTFSSRSITEGEASKPVNKISSLMLSCFCGLSSDTSKLPLPILNRLEKDIRGVRERLDEKIKNSEAFTKLKSVVGGEGGGSKSKENTRPTVGQYINTQRDPLFLGREDVKEEIMEKLLHPSDNRVHIIHIWGMGGIGKTTLALSIYNDQRVKEVSRSWLSVGLKFSAEKVIAEIVNDGNTSGIGNLQKKLEEKLRGDRFLIVLDDVWDVDGSEWDLLLNPLTAVGKGGLIIITKREEKLCDAITINWKDFITAHNLKPLSKQDSWSIFESYANINGKADSTSELKRIAEEIVEKLDGLPLALSVIAHSLSTVDYSTWRDFLESELTKDDEVMSALRWSYNHLPPHLKMCFTYCSLFPEDHVFIEKELVEMWMAHDLIQKEDVGAQYFQELVNASLLQCVDGKYVMHNLIHKLALSVSNGEFASTNSSLTDDQMEKVRHLTIMSGDYSKIPSLCKIEKLLTLYTICSYEDVCDHSVIDVVFKQMKSIRVLVLSSYAFERIPDSISKLKHLRYLDVSKTSVKSLPDSLCHIYNLQMIAAPKAELPKDIVNISSLRYVRARLSTCKGVGKLTSLQELSCIHVCQDDDIRELGDMQILRGTLTIKGLGNVEKLEDGVGALMEKQTRMDRLALALKDHAESTISAQVLDALGCPPNLKCLVIFGYAGVKPPSWMVDGRHKFDKLQTLELFHCPKLESLPPLGELTSLKHLFLDRVGVNRLGKEVYGEVFFPPLESLTFSRMKEGDNFIIQSLPRNLGKLSSLETLRIGGCPQLQSLPPSLGELSSLETLEIYDCPQLQSLPPSLGEHSSLEILEIRDCPQLQSLPPSLGEHSSLETLEIRDCPQLQSLPPSFEELSSLETLKIAGCPQLQSLPPSLGALSSLKFLKINNCRQLQSLPPSLGELSSLETLKINICRQLQSLPPSLGELSSLETLKIFDCPQLRSLPPSLGELSSLKFLKIFHCPQLQSLPPSLGELSSLVYLHIWYCPQLQSLLPSLGELSSLELLNIHSCPQLQSLPPSLGELSSLKFLKINKCRQLQSLPPSLGELSSLETLKIGGCPQLQSLPPSLGELSSLETLFIYRCPQLQSLPPSFGELSSLETLKIDDCPQLQSLPDSFPPCLKYLMIKGSPLLYERCKDKSGLDWHKIKHIRNRIVLESSF